MTEPAFTDDWFSGSAVNGAGAWAIHVLPRLRDRPGVLWLEIGSYEGRSALWTAANLLTGAKSQLVCVDIWPDKYLNRAGERVEEVFDRNTRGDKRIVKLRGKSNQVLPLLRDRSFHGAYVDGSHREANVLEDAREVARLLAPGGIVIFDDYCKNREKVTEDWGVRTAVDKFLAEMGSRAKVIFADWQLIAVLA
jgi:predicted O-methyltransferase YrrM